MVNIGDRVKTDQVLAEIDTPELDQQPRPADVARRSDQVAVRVAVAAVKD